MACQPKTTSYQLTLLPGSRLAVARPRPRPVGDRVSLEGNFGILEDRGPDLSSMCSTR